MTDAEKEFARKIFAQQREGWEYLEAERLAKLAGTVTKEILPSLQSSFAYARTLPPRLESGFTQFYEALERGGRAC